MSKFLLFCAELRVDLIVCRCNWMRNSINTYAYKLCSFNTTTRFMYARKHFYYYYIFKIKPICCFDTLFCRSRRCCLLSHFLLLSCILKYVPYIQIIFNLMHFQDYFKGYAIKQSTKTFYAARIFLWAMSACTYEKMFISFILIFLFHSNCNYFINESRYACNSPFLTLNYISYVNNYIK